MQSRSTAVGAVRRIALGVVAVLATCAAVAAAPAAAACTGGATTTSTCPIEAQFAAAGPYATTTGSLTDAGGRTYTLFYPSNYAALGFASPIITWGNGSSATPSNYTALLTRFASYGFTVIASTSQNTGSGIEIDAGANDLVAANGTSGSPFYQHLDVTKVAAVGHSQGAGGATRAATNDPLITTLLTFSLPATTWVGTNAGCPTSKPAGTNYPLSTATCMYHVPAVTQPVFFLGTRGLTDSLIASPSTQTAYYNSLVGHTGPGEAVVGLVTKTNGKTADHNSVQTDPQGEWGYAVAWLMYRLRGDATAAGAFTGTTPEVLANTNWSGSAVK
jgi:pimeloyl-ACP methyl ester carboxylesterase